MLQRRERSDLGFGLLALGLLGVSAEALLFGNPGFDEAIDGDVFDEIAQLANICLASDLLRVGLIATFSEFIHLLLKALIQTHQALDFLGSRTEIVLSVGALFMHAQKKHTQS